MPPPPPHHPPPHPPPPRRVHGLHRLQSSSETHTNTHTHTNPPPPNPPPHPGGKPADRSQAEEVAPGWPFGTQMNKKKQKRGGFSDGQKSEPSPEGSGHGRDGEPFLAARPPHSPRGGGGGGRGGGGGWGGFLRDTSRLPFAPSRPQPPLGGGGSQDVRRYRSMQGGVGRTASPRARSSPALRAGPEATGNG